MSDQAMPDTAIRINPADGKKLANASVTIETAGHASRLSFRATSKGATAFGKSLGLALPSEPGATSAKGGKHALWLGPDEWLIIDEKQPDVSLMPKLANKKFSATDISHRNVAYIISGSGAESLLNAGCPRDLSLKAFPVGTASRTVFGKAEVVLYRTATNTFRVECWRSFAPYVWALLVDAAKDAHI